jgi:hypothetical protein
MRSVQVWEHLQSHALKCPALGRMHSYMNLPYNLNPMEPYHMSLIILFYFQNSLPHLKLMNKNEK